MVSNNTPLGMSQFYDKEKESTELSWSYLETADTEYWQIEYYDEEKRKWVPFDGRNGIVKRQR